ncbi:MAG: hypothetical protein ACLT69_13145 [Intestinibacter bartlettii]
MARCSICICWRWNSKDKVEAYVNENNNNVTTPYQDGRFNLFTKSTDIHWVIVKGMVYQYEQTLLE